MLEYILQIFFTKEHQSALQNKTKDFYDVPSPKPNPRTPTEGYSDINYSPRVPTSFTPRKGPMMIGLWWPGMRTDGREAGS